MEIAFFVLEHLGLDVICVSFWLFGFYLGFDLLVLSIRSKIIRYRDIIFDYRDSSIFRSNNLRNIHRLVNNITICPSYNLDINNFNHLIFSLIFNSG